jgi:hypothetical protein
VGDGRLGAPLFRAGAGHREVVVPAAHSTTKPHVRAAVDRTDSFASRCPHHSRIVSREFLVAYTHTSALH